MFELLFHIETIAHLSLSFKHNDIHFLNNITYLSINNLFQCAFISEEATYEVN
jgi:hypothetical protein